MELFAQAEKEEEKRQNRTFKVINPKCKFKRGNRVDEDRNKYRKQVNTV